MHKYTYIYKFFLVGGVEEWEGEGGGWESGYPFDKLLAYNQGENCLAFTG